MKMYRVGGCVRDEILGTPSKDTDYTVVLEPEDFPAFGTTVETPDPYGIMLAELERRGCKIFRDKYTGLPVGADYFTARALSPDKYIPSGEYDPNSGRPTGGRIVKGEPVDFVLARKERGYADGRRPSSVEVGTLYDDLARRDFTMNAIAQDMDGNYIDPFNGQSDIAAGVIKAVGDPFERMEEDALRAVRAVRFSVTKEMAIDPGLRFSIESEAVLARVADPSVVSAERIDEELRRMFAYDNMASLRALNAFPLLTEAMLSGTVSLTSTMKTIKTKG